MSDWDLLLTDTTIATMARGAANYGVIRNAALAIRNGRIAWLGPAIDMPAGNAAEARSLGGRWLTPALIDCHTHIVFGGDRALEYEQRLQGVSYEEIANAGGGIKSTVGATREASIQTLVESAAKRVAALCRDGVATVEIKSGYGLNTESEIRMLEAARAFIREDVLSVQTTFLGAHTTPLEFNGRSDDYIDLVVNESLPAAHAKGLVNAVDAFCEHIAFSTEQVTRVFEKAQSLGLPVKLHADQLSDGGGAELAANFAALSADHLEYTSDAGVAALADAGTVAVLLPGAFVTLSEAQKPPVDAFRSHDVPIAVATDCNPGTSPLCSLQQAMQLASRVFKLTPEECFAGVTREAARALGLDDRGTLEVGKRADLAVWSFDHPRDLSYWMGLNTPANVFVNGVLRA